MFAIMQLRMSVEQQILLSAIRKADLIVCQSRQPVRHRQIAYDSVQYRETTQLVSELRHSGWYSRLCYPSWYLKALSTMLAIWRLPRAELTLSASESQAWFGDSYPPVGYRLAGSPWAQSVLTIEADQKYYLTGRCKQALRTNMHHARTAGVKLAIVDYAAFDTAARQILTARRGAPDHTMARDLNERCVYYVAIDKAGTALVFAGVANFGNFGLLFIMLSRPCHPDAAAARYLTHTYVVEDLAKRGKAHLLCGPAFNTTSGKQYFMHLLGYQPMNLHYRIT